MVTFLSNGIYLLLFLSSPQLYLVLACVPTYTPDFPGFSPEAVVSIPGIPGVIVTTPSTTSTTTTSTTSTTTTTTTTTTLPPCPPNGWQLFQGYYYCYVSTAVWKDPATAGCANLGATVVSIHSAAENNFVNGLCMNVDCWIGLSRVCNPPACPCNVDTILPNCWAWDDGTPYDYMFWRPSQPDNFDLVEFCAQMNWHGGGVNGGSWDSINCAPSISPFGAPYPYVCKRAA